MKALSCRTTATSMLKKNGLALFVGIALSSSVHAQETSARTQYAISSGDLVKVVNEISRNSGLQIVYNIDDLQGIRAADVKGKLTVQQALDKALKSTNLSWTQVNPTTISIKKKAPAPQRPSQVGTNVKPPSASSTSADPGASIQELEKMVVVGSRLGVSPVDSAMPIQVITRDQIDRSGSGNIAQVLSYLSEVSVNSNGDRPIGVGDGLQSGANTNSTTVQVRGMPRGTTLVLINGRRAGESATYSDTGQFDLSTIPLSLVDRIEVLPAGSSAIYGGDGLAGVINVVLRRDANGLEMRYRQSHADGYRTRQASALWGKTWSAADITFAANWNDETSLYNYERSLTANQDYIRFGGQDWRSNSTNPANVYSLAGCPASPALCELDLSSRGNLPGLNSPFAVVPQGSNGIGLTPADFLSTQGQEARSSSLRHLRSAERSFGFSMNGRVNLNAQLEAFSELSYSKREVPAYEMPLSTVIPTYGYQYARVPASNPFNPFGVDVAVGYHFPNTGIFSSYEQDYQRGALGLRGTQKHFSWEVSAWGSRDKTATGGAMSFDPAAIAAAVNSTDPQNALNPFVSNGQLPGSPELMRSLVRDLSGSSESKTTGLTGYVRGKPFNLPAGPVIALVGVEHQRQSIETHTNNNAVAYPKLDGSTQSTAYFAEARVPILSARAGESWERVAMTGAVRSESGNRFDSTATTKTIGVEYRPSSSLLLRATHSTAFRPLLIFNAVIPSDYYVDTIADPKFSGEFYDVTIRSGGGAPDNLKPESSKNSTIGFVYRPKDNWSLSVTNWDMEFSDRFSYIDAQSIVDQEDYRPGRVVRNESTGLIEEVDTRQVNIALIHSAGIDLGVDSSWTTRIGDFKAYLSATYTYKYEQRSAAGAPIEDRLGTRSSDGWAPRWKIVPRVSWDHGALRAMLTGKYIGKYEDSLSFQTGPNAGEPNELGDFWIVDANIDLDLGSYTRKSSFFSRMNLNLGVTNLANRLPDFCVGCYDAGYDASQYDIMGRTIYAEIRKSF